MTKTATILIALLVTALASCSSSTAPEQTGDHLPLIAYDDNGDQGLAGTYDIVTEEAWLADSLVDSAFALAAGGVVESNPMLVIMAGEAGRQVDRETGYSFLSTDLSQNQENLRACIVDSEGNRWTVANLRLGTVDEQAATQPSFKATRLETESHKPCNQAQCELQCGGPGMGTCTGGGTCACY